MDTTLVQTVWHHLEFNVFNQRQSETTSASNFEAQGNQYSSYKGHTTYKFLVAIAPNGAILFVSDAYEGSISDKEIVRVSGFLDFLNPREVVMAQRGFLIKELLNEGM